LFSWVSLCERNQTTELEGAPSFALFAKGGLLQSNAPLPLLLGFPSHPRPLTPPLSLRLRRPHRIRIPNDLLHLLGVQIRHRRTLLRPQGADVPHPGRRRGKSPSRAQPPPHRFRRLRRLRHHSRLRR